MQGQVVVERRRRDPAVDDRQTLEELVEAEIFSQLSPAGDQGDSPPPGRRRAIPTASPRMSPAREASAGDAGTIDFLERSRPGCLVWTRRELLTAALGVTAMALLPATDVGRPGEEWVAEAANIDRRAEEWGPTATLANAAGLLHRLDVAIVRAPRELERRPLHVAAAIAGAVAARTARWSGDAPDGYLTAADAHAAAAHAPRPAPLVPPAGIEPAHKV